MLAAPAHAKPPKPMAELVTKQVTASYSSGKVTAGASVKNKGNKKAPASVATFFLSVDAKQSVDDTRLGTAPVGKIKPKRSKPVGGTFVVPSSVAPGSYHVVVCADSGAAVVERKETNNCKGSKATLAMVAPTGPITVAATAGSGGTVAVSGVTGASCAVTTCTFPTPGTGTVTFTPTASSGYRFSAWAGTTCTGHTSGSGDAITFTNPTSDKACTATFVPQVSVTWEVAPVQVSLVGSVSGAATAGACETDALTGGGSCLVDAGVGNVVLSATSLIPELWVFDAWSATGGGSCDGTANGATMTFNNPAAAKSCTATFKLLGII